MRKLHGRLGCCGRDCVRQSPARPGAQTATPYKLGMFEQNGRAFVGLVINNDTLVVDLSRANVSAPATLKQLIAGWDAKMGTARWRRSRPSRRRDDPDQAAEDAAADSRSVGAAQRRRELQRARHRDDRPGHGRRQRRQGRSEGGDGHSRATGPASPAIRGTTRITS